MESSMVPGVLGGNIVSMEQSGRIAAEIYGHAIGDEMLKAERTLTHYIKT